MHPARAYAIRNMKQWLQLHSGIPWASADLQRPCELKFTRIYNKMLLSAVLKQSAQRVYQFPKISQLPMYNWLALPACMTEDDRFTRRLKPCMRSCQGLVLNA